jgi:hypothetical protein
MTGFLTQFDLGMLGQNEKCLNRKNVRTRFKDDRILAVGIG